MNKHTTASSSPMPKDRVNIPKNILINMTLYYYVQDEVQVWISLQEFSNMLNQAQRPLHQKSQEEELVGLPLYPILQFVKSS